MPVVSDKGKLAAVITKAATGRAERHDKESGFDLCEGDVVAVETGGGGGYGPPAERDLALVQQDLDSGVVSPAAAIRDYAVTISPDGKVSRP